VTEGSHCRLCGGAVVPSFRKTLLHKYDVTFSKCGHCLSLQTETPYWLEEAYADDRPLTDCGMVTRTLDLAMKMDLVLSILGVGSAPPCIDTGGSLGLFSRMMRDRGYNFFRSDPYSRNFYVPFHDAEENKLTSAAVVTAFEVMEHLSNPKLELNRLFLLSPDVFVASTEVYRDQTPDWWYYAPDIGQHVFFYSPSALQAIAECYQMHLISNGTLHLFCRRSPQFLNYGPHELLNLKQVFDNGQRFYLESLQLFGSKLVDPYRWVNKDYVDILGQIRAKDNGAAKIAEGFLRSRQISPTTV